MPVWTAKNPEILNGLKEIETSIFEGWFDKAAPPSVNVAAGFVSPFI